LKGLDVVAVVWGIGGGARGCAYTWPESSSFTGQRVSLLLDFHHVGSWPCFPKSALFQVREFFLSIKFTNNFYFGCMIIYLLKLFFGVKFCNFVKCD
jgi:hypothetical protein